MKNSILFLFASFLLILSCKPKESTKNHAQAIVNNIAENAIPECFTSYQVYAETAIFWQTAWTSYYNNVRGGNYINSPRVSFDALNLNNLYNEVKDKDHPGVLLWYTLLDPNDSIPSLAIQNTIECKIDQAGTILLASANDSSLSVDTITQGYLNTIKHNWSETSLSTPGVYTKINGYNYEWDSIQQLMNLSTGPQGIYIHYGLRTIGPDESENYATPANPDKTGSIIYCNIIYGDNFELNPTATLLDFAMPCPAYCGRN